MTINALVSPPGNVRECGSLRYCHTSMTKWGIVHNLFNNFCDNLAYIASAKLVMVKA